MAGMGGEWFLINVPVTEHLVQFSQYGLVTRATECHATKALTSPRRVGGIHTRMLDLDTTSVARPRSSDCILESSTFEFWLQLASTKTVRTYSLDLDVILGHVIPQLPYACVYVT